MRVGRQAVALALAGLAGCGLIDSLRGTSFQLPSRSYSIATSDPRWRPPPPGGVPTLSCGPGGVVPDCCAPPAPAPTIDCGRSPLACEAGACVLRFAYEQASTVDLAKEVPALQTIKGQVLSDVLLQEIELSVVNGLDLELPAVHLFIAPAGVASASHAAARRLVTLPPTPPGHRGQQLLPLDAAAQRAFSDFARDFQSPFNLIVSTTIVLRGAAAPVGKLDLTVTGKVEARL